MVAIILLIVGIVMVVVGTVTFFSFRNSGVGSVSNSFGYNFDGLLLLPSLIPWLIGGLLILWAIVLLIKGKARREELRQIAATGTDAEGYITFVDRNYSVLVNNRPIYSIVEYRFRDYNGHEFVNRADNLDTNFVLRSGWQVGSSIRVRYLPKDPTKSAIVAAELQNAMVMPNFAR
jgi:hypothetical protein